MRLFALLLACFLDVTTARAAVGVIMGSDLPFCKQVKASIEKHLRAAGVEAEILVQRPAPQAMAWTNTARKLEAFDATVIVMIGAPVGVEPVTTGADLPIVFAAPRLDIADKSGNVTGVTWEVPLASILKSLKSLRDYKKLGLVATERHSANLSIEGKRLASKLSYEALPILMPQQSAKLAQADALVVAIDCGISGCLDEVLGVARDRKIPTASSAPGSADRGVVLHMGANAKELGKKTAELVVRILDGSDASSLPVVAARKVEVVLNVKEAKTLGVEVPFDLLSTATRVIQ